MWPSRLVPAASTYCHRRLVAVLRRPVEMRGRARRSRSAPSKVYDRAAARALGQPSAASDAPLLLGLGRQGLLVPGCHALNHRHKEAWPEQGSSRRGHVCKNRAKNALTGSRSCALAGRGARSHLSCALWIELRAFLRVRAANNNTATNEARPGVSLETATISPGPRPPPNPKTRPAKPKTQITLETPYTGSSSRPLQSPFGP